MAKRKAGKPPHKMSLLIDVEMGRPMEVEVCNRDVSFWMFAERGAIGYHGSCRAGCEGAWDGCTASRVYLRVAQSATGGYRERAGTARGISDQCLRRNHNVRRNRYVDALGISCCIGSYPLLAYPKRRRVVECYRRSQPRNVRELQVHSAQSKCIP